MQLDVIDDSGSVAQKLEASDAIFARTYNEALVHQLVVAYQANARQGTRAQKGRSEIAKSTRKPWKQKGSGQARAGRASSPLWRGGGKTFASSPDENFSHKINRSMYRAAMAVILSKLVSDGRLAVLEKLEVEAPKTKLFHHKVKTLGLDSVMFVTDEADEKVLLAARNLPNVLVTESKYIDPLSLIFYKKTLVTRAALARIEEMFA